MEKKLTRSATNRVLAGICGGLGEYLGVDATLIRIIWVAAIMFGGSGIGLYFIAALLMPEPTTEINDENAFDD